MAVVVDANLLVAFATDDSRAPLVISLIQRWTDQGEPLHAPALFFYEIASGLTGLVASGALPRERLTEVWQTILRVPIELHALREEAPEVVSIALRLRRRSAYDAAYLALAEQLGAELRTFDGPLARNAASIGYPVHLVE